MEHQHFIPRSYLKNFAQIENKGKRQKAFVAICDKTQKQERIVSTKDICVRSNLYTLNDHKDDCFLLEKYYATHVDDEFPKIHSLLTFGTTQVVSKTQKTKIINTLLSIYFRTPRVLDALKKVTDVFLEKALITTEGNSIELRFFDNEPVIFHREDASKVQQQLRERNRITFLQAQFSNWNKFVRLKSEALIGVCKIEGNSELITCDNPVTIRNSKGQGFDLWDPENMIQINLDPNHLVYISPNSIVEGNPTAILYQRRSEEFAITSNHSCLRNASRWLIGKPGTLVKAIESIEDFDADSQKSTNSYNGILEKHGYLIKLDELAREYGFSHVLTIKQMKMMKEMDLFKSDPAFQDTLALYHKKGFSI